MTPGAPGRVSRSGGPAGWLPGLIALVIYCYMFLAQIVKTWVVRRIAATAGSA
ncbi:hypothetical protein [Solidesulfovibrio sp.]